MTKQNDPFNNTSSRFGSRNPISEQADETNESYNSEYYFPDQPEREESPEYFSNENSPLPPSFQKRKNPTDDLFTNVEEEVEEEDESYMEDATPNFPPMREATNNEMYRYLFNEQKPENWENETYTTITDEEDDYLGKIFESSTTDIQQTLYALSSDDNENVRITVAQNLNCPPGLLKELAKDSSDEVRRAVMENPNTPFEVYNRFYTDEDLFLVADWVESEKTTTQMLEPLYNTTEDFIADTLINSGKLPDNIKVYLQQRFNI